MYQYDTVCKYWIEEVVKVSDDSDVSEYTPTKPTSAIYLPSLTLGVLRHFGLEVPDGVVVGGCVLVPSDKIVARKTPLLV